MFLRLGQLPGLPGRREQGQHPSRRRENEKGAFPEEGLGESESPLWCLFISKSNSNQGLTLGLILFV